MLMEEAVDAEMGNLRHSPATLLVVDEEEDPVSSNKKGSTTSCRMSLNLGLPNQLGH